jgi:hypothetical protein
MIVNRKTRAFFRAGRWTPDQKRAQNFPDATAVIHAAIRYNLIGVEMVLQFGVEPSDAYDFRWPLFNHGQ